MGTTKIRMDLSVESIQSAINQLEQYKITFMRKVEVFTERLAEYGNSIALEKIAESPIGKTVVLRSEKTVMDAGCKMALIAVGQTHEAEGYAPFNTLLAIEFGAGIYYNPIPNPKANDLGYGVGTFPDQIHAFEDGWYYLGLDDKWHYTHGVKATMPMYSATVAIIQDVKKIAKEVFG